MNTSPAGSNEAELLRLSISANHDAINTYVERIVGEIRVEVARAIREELTGATAPQAPKSSTLTATSPATGMQLSKEERFKAADLRTALLMGKIPDDAGLLIDVKTAASLLNVSPRTLYRLHSVGATPDPVRIGRLVRFRLAELLAWIEADCPPKKHWSYSPTAAQPKRRK